jgi:MT0933-like antitoxin protein
MGLLNAKNIAKARALAEKNKDKIAAGVNKATEAIDKKTGGKHTDKLKKIDDAAKKFADPDAVPAAQPDASTAAQPDVAPDAAGAESETPTTQG